MLLCNEIAIELMRCRCTCSLNYLVEKNDYYCIYRRGACISYRRGACTGCSKRLRRMRNPHICLTMTCSKIKFVPFRANYIKFLVSFISSIVTEIFDVKCVKRLLEHI